MSPSILLVLIQCCCEVGSWGARGSGCMRTSLQLPVIWELFQNKMFNKKRNTWALGKRLSGYSVRCANVKGWVWSPVPRSKLEARCGSSLLRVSVLVSIAAIKHKAIWGGVISARSSTAQSVITGGQGRDPWQESKQKPRRNNANWLALHDILSLLPIEPRTPFPGWRHTRWAGPFHINH